MAEVGAMLRDRRVELGHDIETVASQTHIKISYLKAIEDGRRRDLPGAAYTIGFVRTYADFLGFDGNRLVTDFHAQLAGVRSRPAGQGAQPAAELPKLTISPVMIAGAVLVLALVGFFLWGYLSDSSNNGDSAEDIQEQAEGEAAVAEGPAADTPGADAPGADTPGADAQGSAAAPESVGGAPTDGTVAAEPGATDGTAPASTSAAAAQSVEPNAAAADGAAPPVDDQLPPEAEVDAAAEPSPEPVQEAAAVEGGSSGKVVLRAKLESWVQITNEKGESVFSRVLRAGETYTVPAEKGLLMTTGNAGGIEVLLDGKKLKSLGSVGLVRRDFPLDAQKLKDGSAFKPSVAGQTNQ